MRSKKEYEMAAPSQPQRVEELTHARDWRQSAELKNLEKASRNSPR